MTHVRRGLTKAERRQAVFDRDGNACLRCGAEEDLTLDHILPRAKGGTSGYDNLQTLCEPCNAAKADRSMSYRADTWQDQSRPEEGT